MWLLTKIGKKWDILVKIIQKMGNFGQKQAKNGKFWTKIVKKWEIFVKNMQKMGNFCQKQEKMGNFGIF